MSTPLQKALDSMTRYSAPKRLSLSTAQDEFTSLSPYSAIQPKQSRSIEKLSPKPCRRKGLAFSFLKQQIKPIHKMRRFISAV